ncbi:MAG TPA: GIY-YIG nuclease family protein, partial [Casimicrobiaceae bacterium]|nr:GIY-YIG nuclease family protein [Casimicrobiaceae bacterium]
GGFTREFGVHTLVWFEEHEDACAAIAREKQIKHWKRAWKIALVERCNPQWNDLYEAIVG